MLVVILLVVGVVLPVGAVSEVGGGTALGGGRLSVGGFSDVAGVHGPAVEALAAEGVFEGTECEPALFCPSQPILRWEMAVWLVRVLDGEDPAEALSTFGDVDPGLWWSPFVERLAELGVTSGCSSIPRLFCPDEAVTRAQMASFLVRAFGLEAGASAGFGDVDARDTHAANIDALAATGITQGCTEMLFCPRRDTTRAQMATFLNRAIQIANRLPDEWLARVNAYRTGSGLSAVTEQPEWSDGLIKHLEYLRYTDRSLRTGTYSNAHYQNPESPYYTEEGAAAGRSANLGTAKTDTGAIDQWMAAPFHAIGILRARLNSVAFARSDHPGLNTGLDVIRGLGWAESAAEDTVLFPGQDSWLPLNRFRGELPSPLETCPGYSAGRVGLPLIIMLPDDPPPSASAHLVGPGDVRYSTDDGSLCRVDEHTYTTTDTVYGSTGRSILKGANAVLLIANEPLASGRWQATYSTPGGHTLTWSFNIYK